MPEYARAGHEQRRARADQLRDVLEPDPAVDLDRHLGREQLPEPLHPAGRLRQVRLARVARVDAHAEHEIGAAGRGSHLLGGALGVERDAERQAELARLRLDGRQLAPDDFIVDGHAVRPGLRERLEVLVRVLGHQVDVEDSAPLAEQRRDRLQDDRPDRDRLDEVPVADVELEDLGAGVEQLGQLVAEPREVGRVDGRLDLGAARPVAPTHGGDPASVAFLGRRCRCGAGGHSMSNTGPESTVPAAASGGGGAGLRPAGAVTGQGRYVLALATKNPEVS